MITIPQDRVLKIGLIVPANNTVIETELNQIFPKNITIQIARLRPSGSYKASSTPRELVKLADQVEEVARIFASNVDAVAYCCLGSSFVKGVGWDKELTSKIERITNTPSTTASSAMIDALIEANITRLAVATPYSEEKNALLRQFLEGNGFHVVNIVGLTPPPSPTEVGQLPLSVTIELVRSAFLPDVEGIFIGATDLKTVQVLPKLVTELQKPIISANQAIAWKLLQMVKT